MSSERLGLGLCGSDSIEKSGTSWEAVREQLGLFRISDCQKRGFFCFVLFVGFLFSLCSLFRISDCTVSDSLSTHSDISV